MNFEVTNPYDINQTFKPAPRRVNVRSLYLANPDSDTGIDIERSYCQSTNEFKDFDAVCVFLIFF